MFIPDKAQNLLPYVLFVACFLALAGTILFVLLYRGLSKTQHQAESGLYLIIPTVIMICCFLGSVICLDLYSFVIIWKWWFTL